MMIVSDLLTSDQSWIFSLWWLGQKGMQMMSASDADTTLIGSPKY